MEYVLEERIGNPDLFTGRKKELTFFLDWIFNIKERKSMSTALLARRKMGKTALMERLFNITFARNDGIIPFYYEFKERKMWVVEFCKDFFLTFIYQYIAFKSRKPGYLEPQEMLDMGRVKKIVIDEGLDYLTPLIDSVEYGVHHNQIDNLWETVRKAPHTIAFHQKEYIVQMIDEFQFLNSLIYLDKEKKNLANDLAGGYLGTAESKIAPLLVSGSWVGWLMNLLTTMLPARFRYRPLENMSEDEAIEMVYNYSRVFNVPVTQETAFLIAEISEGSPFYISSIINSLDEGKDLTTMAGLTRTLEFETLDNRGNIKYTWMEYVNSTFSQINNKNAKKIVLYLCKNRDEEKTRKQILDDLKLDMTDEELEKKLKALIQADIIARGSSNFRYRGVRDNIFDKVFRGVYEDEIQEFDINDITKEYNQILVNLKKEYNSLLGKFNWQKGLFTEYILQDQLRLHALEKNEFFKSLTQNLPADFNFCHYSRVWKYDYSPEYTKNFNIDIFARAKDPHDYSIIAEVKNRQTKKFSREEAESFYEKFLALKAIENLDKALALVFSPKGFTLEAEAFCQEKQIATSHDPRWLDT